MNAPSRKWSWLFTAFLVTASIARSAPAEPKPEQIEFFEKTIRPVFAEHCYGCHSEKAEKLKGGLRLDTPEALQKGGDSGPALVPGNPDASLLIKAVRYADPDLQMPPKNKRLSAEHIASLETWVKMGAPLPRTSTSGRRPLTDIAEARARHWAFQPVTKPRPPAVKRSRWVQTPVDNFVLAALEKKHIKPAPVADRRTLIRRVTYDLIGLPPADEEVEAFMEDKGADAYPRLVDRLLASPHYGERWGRYWLDVARYADTKGYLAGGEERRYPFSYTYRDYVVRAFNEDKPYDQFLIEQIAADLLPRPADKLKSTAENNEASLQPQGLGVRQPPGDFELAAAPAKAPESEQHKSGPLCGLDWRTPRRWRAQAGDQQSLAALGFLTLGRRFLNNQNDIIDDRIDVVTRGTLGLTVTCARCHDHKFDPISTKDYYALHGVFASSEEAVERPLLGPLRDSPAYQDYLKEKAKIEAEIVDFKAKEVAKFIGELRQHVGDYLLGAHDAGRLEDELKFETFAGERQLNPVVLRRWMSDLAARSKKADPIFSPWFELLKGSHDQPGKDTLSSSDGERDGVRGLPPSPTANPVVAKALAQPATNSLKAAADVYNKLFKDVEAEWQTALASATKEKKPPPTALPEADREDLRQVLYGEGAPGNLPRAEAEGILSRRLHEGTAPMRNRIEALNWTHPGAPPRAMAMADRSGPANSHVFIRGNPGTPGEEVPRRFLEVLSPLGYGSAHTEKTNLTPLPFRRGEGETPAPQAPLPFTNGSGRLELARAIANPENPLTARVYINRVWQHHFGEGLVSTPGDFGVRTQEPVCRALLDYLAASLVENGWSTKYVHRLILLSATYQQSSDASPASLKADPDNGLLSRMNRQRLDFEALRDTLLAFAGKLELSLGGVPVDLQAEPFSTRRTIYGLIDRQNLPGLFRTFDFANPDTSNQGRFHTTVPQQALFLMNSPFVIEQARALARRVEAQPLRPIPARQDGERERRGSTVEKIQALYRFVLQRPATRGEIALGEKFMAAQPQAGANLSPLEKYAQILLLSNELMFVD